MQYKNDNITIHWDQSNCIHAGVYVRSLPNVYNPKERPWVKIENASTEKLKAQIDKCPSGALSYTLNKNKDK
ncbi:(4Fe-4S)-binding protein [Vicingaceae bacterium]|nr:(4Fe-4S)-binding protein [Vicingaceae bacterium]MDB4061876.1 (4Fe-4S)-binding protein [Vicingaceae bacterium]